MGETSSKPSVGVDEIPNFEDYYAALKAEGKVVHVHRTPQIKGEIKINPEINKKISLWRGDITTLAIDGIVNAANSELYAGGGICGAIHRAAGRELEAECKAIGGCPTGQTALTQAYRLPCKTVLHSVGPTSYRPDLLTACYNSILDLCKEHNLRTVALCCISTGIFGYPNGPACVTALTTVRQWLERSSAHAAAIDRVIFCTFQKQDVDLYDWLTPIVFPVEQENVTTDRAPDAKEPEPPKLAVEVGAFNDAFDGRSWLKAEVMEVDEEKHLCFVHYTGYSKKYDEWLDYQAEEDAMKLRPLTQKGGVKWKLERRVPGEEEEASATTATASTAAATTATTTTTAATGEGESQAMEESVTGGADGDDGADGGDGADGDADGADGTEGGDGGDDADGDDGADAEGGEGAGAADAS